VKLKLLARNVLTEVHLPVPRSNVARETKAFRPEEAKTILRASLAVQNTESANTAARRWVPWICAYTGARSGEITQLRGVDVIKQDRIDAIRITPDAGTVKTKQARLVPLHSHLIEQGFLSFVANKGKGPRSQVSPVRILHTVKSSTLGPQHDQQSTSVQVSQISLFSASPSENRIQAGGLPLLFLL
jgi:integrase